MPEDLIRTGRLFCGRVRHRSPKLTTDASGVVDETVYVLRRLNEQAHVVERLRLKSREHKGIHRFGASCPRVVPEDGSHDAWSSLT